MSEGDQKAKVSLLSWLLLFAAAVTVVWVRVRLLSLPLERDEGEYAYVGQWLLRGVPPYESGANMKFPGVYFAWALMMAIFGESLRSIRLAVLVVDLAIAGGLFIVVRRFASASAARLSAAILLLLLADSGTLALYGHATRFVAAALVLGLLFMTSRLRDAIKVFLVGASFALAFLAKQHAIFFVVFGLWWLLSSTSAEPVARRVRLALLYIAGLAIPLAGVVLWLQAMGVLRQAWFWTIEYASAYTGIVGMRGAVENLTLALRRELTGAIALWLFGIAAVVLLWPHRSKLPRWVYPLLVLSVLTVMPGLYFREHYFLTIMPALAIVSGLTVDYLGRPLVAALLLLAAAFAAVLSQSAVYFVKTPAEVTRATYATNPFAESIPIGAYIAAHTAPDDRIAVLGSEPQIYFYSGRRSATEFIYMYPLLERQEFAVRMQQRMCEEITTTRPSYIVAVNVTTSWLGGRSSPKLIFECLTPFIREQYSLVGVVDIDKPESVFVWGPEAMRYKWGRDYVLVFHRKRG